MTTRILFSLLLSSSILSLNAQSLCSPFYVEYIQKYQEAAIQEMRRSGVPASIKLAQALHESNAGKSALATNANNHFGIKCGGSWDGPTYHAQDDEINASCFRVYESVATCYAAHSDFLRDGKRGMRYRFLFDLSSEDYRGWCNGLQSAGYATNPEYANILIGIIEKYQLQQLDQGIKVNPDAYVFKNTNDATASVSQPLTKMQVNSCELVIVRENDNLNSIANFFRKKVKDIQDWNDHKWSETQSLKAGTWVYLEKKKKKYQGAQQWHIVKAGESMWDIAQKYGIRLEKLYKLNRYESGQEPAINSRVAIQSKVKKDEKPSLRIPGNEIPNPPTTDPVVNQPIVQNSNVNISSNQNSTITHPKVNTTNSGFGFIIQSGKAEVISEIPGIPSEETSTIEDAMEPITVQKENPVIYSDQASVITIPSQVQIVQEDDTNLYIIKVGDTLYNISKRFGTTVSALQTLNQLPDTNLKLGQSIRIR